MQNLNTTGVSWTYQPPTYYPYHFPSDYQWPAYRWPTGCPSCGHCPACGRRGWSIEPTWVYQPGWIVQPTITSDATIVSASADDDVLDGLHIAATMIENECAFGDACAHD